MVVKANGYGEIVESLRARIQAGELGCGTRLPNIRDLATSFGVNYTTAQRATSELQRAGYVVARGRHGCTVTDDWTRLTPALGGLKTAPPRPLRLGMIVGDDAARHGDHPSQLMSIERVLTSRVCGEGGSLIRFPQPANGMQVAPGLVREICRAPLDVLVIPNSLVRIDEASYQQLEDDGKTCVVYAGTLADETDRDMVRVDDVWAFRTIADRLWQMGHRRIAYLGFSPDQAGLEWNRVRHAAWRQALAARGARPLAQDAVLLGDHQWANAVPKRLAAYDAVVCANDNWAAFLIEAFRKLRVRVPEDVSVTGYDNMCGDRIPAGVTTFTLPYERVVAAIMAIAARRMQRDEEAGDRISITLRPVLIPRATWCERD